MKTRIALKRHIGFLTIPVGLISSIIATAPERSKTSVRILLLLWTLVLGIENDTTCMVCLLVFLVEIIR